MISMRISVSVDIDEFMDHWNADDLDKLIADEIKSDIKESMKASHEYKTFILKQAGKAMEKLLA